MKIRLDEILNIGIDKFNNKKIIIRGWISKIRDHGGLKFIDLRDNSQYIQVVVTEVESIPNIESYIEIEGIIKKRPEISVNRNISTGKYEIVADKIIIINESKELPVSLDTFEDDNVSETLRLTYRYLDIRTDRMSKNLKVRSSMYSSIYSFLFSKAFKYIDTPYLSYRVESGAGMYYVQTKDNKYYGLAQSPQVYKQLLMVGGIDKYFQIVRCFRDEDLRLDRQPEFTQLDIELRDVDTESVINLIVKLIEYICKSLEINNISFDYMDYDDAIRDYGTDKPDLRYKNTIINLVEIFKDTECNVFKNKYIKGFLIEDSNVSLNELYKFEDHIYKSLNKRIATFFCNDGKISGKLVNKLSITEKESLLSLSSNQNYFIVVCTGNEDMDVSITIGEIRAITNNKYNPISDTTKRFLIVRNFPMFEFSLENKVKTVHHQFTTPIINSDNYMNWKSLSYDLVCNGYELGSGSIRIHDYSLQKKIYEIINYDYDKDPLLMSLQYGAPPHGGVAIGLDRLLMILLDLKNIREIISFPKNSSGYDPMSNTPFLK